MTVSSENTDQRSVVAGRLVAWFNLDKFLSLAILAGMGLLFGNIWHLTARLLSAVIISLASISGSVFQPVQLAGVILVSVAALAKAARAGKILARNDIEAQTGYFKSYSGLTAPERQIRFPSLYGAQPPADTIDALINHPTDPLGMIKMYSVSGKHFKRDGPWFALRSEWHSTKVWTWIVLCLVAGMLTLASLTAGLWMTLSSQPPFADLISGPTALLEAVIFALGTNALVQDLRDYAQAYYLIAAKPPSA
ncbi:hypothetical protein AB4Z52_35965 [Rhizobium sp. 2YAF20]|uniref:hypothetical protein n=1 Tax=Rhizobium sp. 2YAF20 TaxID=3233027 RepID=UPI003F99FED7